MAQFINIAENARPRPRALAVIIIAAVVAIPLFAFGLGFPLEYRVRGDAYEYLAAADRLDGFSSILNYAGDRAAGLPLFELAVRKALTLYTSSPDLLLWVNAICSALLIVHIAAAWLFSLWARRTNLVKSESGTFLLFIFLATYPALIGHTTSPLSDTLAVDLVLCAIASLETSFAATSIRRAAVFSAAAGLLFGYAILVRPGSILGIAAALTTAGVISLFSAGRKTNVIGGAVLGCAAILAPFVSSCAQKYGTLCVQSPSRQTDTFVVSAQSGLRGARTLWSKGSLVPGEPPTLPDETMFAAYYRRCQLKSIFGIDDSSLAGCLLSRPLSIPAYAVKKWIGLFDHFRFTPYLETYTPFWLRWLSRAYDSVAWIGFALVFWSLLQAMQRQHRAELKRLATNNITPALLVAYSVAMLALHTILHVEDRYGFPILPLCALLLAMYGENCARQYRASGWKSIGPIALYAVAAWAMFVVQIIAWDRTPFY